MTTTLGQIDQALHDVRGELNQLAVERPTGTHHGHDAPWAWFGSVVMLLNGVPLGLDRDASDLDVFVDGWIWQQLVNEYGWRVDLPDPADPPFASVKVADVKVCAFYRWTGQDPEVNADHCRLTAERVHGHWCTPLPIVRTHKLMASKHGAGGRYAKHAADVEIIDAYMGRATHL